MTKGQLEHSVEDGLAKTMDCCLSDGILVHGGVSRPGSSSEVDMLPKIAQGRQNTSVSIGSTIRAPFVSLVATMKASEYPVEASVSSLAVVCVPSEVVPTKAVHILASENWLLRRGFLGSKNASHPLPTIKEASSSVKGSKVVVEEPLVCYPLKKHAAELGLRLSEPFPRMSKGGAPIYSAVSKSQIGYARRVKEKIAKQLQNNKDLFVEVVVETAENYLEKVLDAMKFTSTVRLSSGEGGDEKSLESFSEN